MCDGSLRVCAYVKASPVQTVAPAAVEVDLGGDAAAAAGELETRCGTGSETTLSQLLSTCQHFRTEDLR